MAFNNSSNSEEITDINITPFVDVVLVLLVIFMVTAPMIAQQVLDLKLPNSVTSVESQAETVGVAVTRQGQLLLNGDLLSKEAFLAECRRQKSMRPRLQAILAADGESAHKFVVEAIDLLRQAGIENIAFQVEKPSSDEDEN